MCILFLYVNDNPDPETYKLILVVNRDEMYKRPTAPAKFWGTTPDIIGGMDLEPGREGGTWLAMNKTGKIAALLNVLQSRESLASAGQRKGRGFIVNNFLKSSKTGMEYMTELSGDAAKYNPFNLVTIESIQEDIPRTCFFSCATDSKPVELPAGSVHGIGNSRLNAPFQKVITGQKFLNDFIQRTNHLARKEELIDGIIRVMRNNQSFYPDPQIHKQAPDQPEEFLRGIAGRFIKLPGYGTRTHTIILVDYNNNVCFKETTLDEPIDEDKPQWSTSSYDFVLEKTT